MKYELTVDDDGILTLPDELLETLGWKEGDDLEWTDNGDGSYQIKKVNEYK